MTAVVLSLGQALFSPSVISGLLFLAGLTVSNWRHAVIALCGAAVGTLVSYYYRDVDPASVNLGLYGFNGVLTAVAVYVICGGKLRLAILGALRRQRDNGEGHSWMGSDAPLLAPELNDLGEDR